MEALKFAVDRVREDLMEADEKQIVIVKTGVGHVSESDVDLAESFGARFVFETRETNL